MPSLPTAEIETIVRMVIDRLRDRGASVLSQTHQTARSSATIGTAAIDSPSLTTANQTKPAPLPTRTTVPDRVVSLKSLPEQMEGINELVVGPSAIITPAVSDHLRRLGIKLSRQSPAGATLTVASSQQTERSGLSSSTNLKWFVVASQVKSAAAAAIAHRQQAQAIIELPQAAGQASWFADHDPNKLRSIWCSLRPYEAQVALAKHSISHIALLHPNDLDRAIHQAWPSIIVLDDQRWSSGQLGRLLQQWARLENAL